MGKFKVPGAQRKGIAEGARPELGQPFAAPGNCRAAATHASGSCTGESRLRSAVWWTSSASQAATTDWREITQPLFAAPLLACGSFNESGPYFLGASGLLPRYCTITIDGVRRLTSEMIRRLRKRPSRDMSWLHDGFAGVT